MKYQRQRTKSKDITYSLYLYCLGLSLESQQKLYIDLFIQIMYQSENGFKNTNQSEFQAKGKILMFIIDKTQIKVGY